MSTLSPPPSAPSSGVPSADRTALRAALAFVDGATEWGEAGLAAWFRDHAHAIGRDTPPRSALVPAPGAAPPLLAAMLAPRKAPRDPLAKHIAATRWQVIMTVRGLLATPCDDRFLNAAIFAGRVLRDGGRWRLTARDGDALRDMVLGLFAVDVLHHREFHQQNLCICDTCGRISYDPATTTRAGCVEHPPRSDAARG